MSSKSAIRYDGMSLPRELTEEEWAEIQQALILDGYDGDPRQTGDDSFISEPFPKFVPLESLTNKKLREQAKIEGVDLNGATSKAKLVEAIATHRMAVGPGVTTTGGSTP